MPRNLIKTTLKAEPIETHPNKNRMLTMNNVKKSEAFPVKYFPISTITMWLPGYNEPSSFWLSLICTVNVSINVGIFCSSYLVHSLFMLCDMCLHIYSMESFVHCVRVSVSCSEKKTKMIRSFVMQVNFDNSHLVICYCSPSFGCLNVIESNEFYERKTNLFIIAGH